MSEQKKDILGENDSALGMRLNKYLSDAGYCSRREADRLVEAGKVLINGLPAVMGQKVMEGDRVEIDGQVISRNDRLILLAFNKPKGIVCTTDRVREKNNIIDYIGYPERIYPIGRLDKDSEGLILLTNDGSLVNHILKASQYHEKEYVVRVEKPVTEEFLAGMASGVPILDTVTRPCKVRRLNDYTFSIVLTQGLNRQIRYMCRYFDYHVRHLKRVRIMNIQLGSLEKGKYREVTASELANLKQAFLKNQDPKA